MTTTLSLSIELTSLAFETAGSPASPRSLLRKVEDILSRRPDILGHITGKKMAGRRDLGGGLYLQVFRLDYERSSLLFELVRLRQRGNWEVKGFRFV